MQHLYLKAGYISKGSGAGLHAAAAYRAGETLYEAMNGNAPSLADNPLAGKIAYDSGSLVTDTARRKEHDYRRKEKVVTTFINAPDDAPAWAGDVQSLCDAITAEETHKNARLARKFEISLGRGLTDEQQADVCKRFCDEHFTRYGLISVVSLHNTPASDGDDNPHAHILVASRTVSGEGWHKDKNNIRWMNSKATLELWRQKMGEYVNEALTAAGIDRPVTYNSYASLGIEREVTVPLGPKAAGLERQGIATEQGTHNREVRQRNAMREAQARERHDGNATGSAPQALSREEKLLRFTCHAARKVLGGHYQDIEFKKDERELFSAAQAALQGFEKGQGTAEERKAAFKVLAPVLETLHGEKKGSLTTYAQIADALERAKGIVTDLHDPQKQEEARRAAEEREARRQAERELAAHRRRLQGKEAGPVWADFGAQVGASVDAARDAVHRFRQKDAEKEDNVSDDSIEKQRQTLQRRDTISSGDNQVATTFRDASITEQRQEVQRRDTVNSGDNRIATTFRDTGIAEQRQGLQQREPKDGTAEQARTEKDTNRQGNAAQTPEAIGATLKQRGAEYRGSMPDKENASPSYAPDVRAPQQTEKGMQRVHPADQERTAKMAQRIANPAQPGAQQATKNNTNPQQSHDIMRGHGKDLERSTSLAGKYAGPMSDKDIQGAVEKAKATQQNKGRDDR